MVVLVAYEPQGPRYDRRLCQDVAALLGRPRPRRRNANAQLFCPAMPIYTAFPSLLATAPAYCLTARLLRR